MVEAFLDSSVIWAFVGSPELEPHHNTCVRLFEREDVRRFASRTVEREIRNSERQRTVLYGRLVQHLVEGRKPGDFRVDGFGRHVAERARLLVGKIRRAEADTEYFRLLMQSEAARVRSAIRRIEQPFVASGTDVYFRDLVLRDLSLTLNDASIVTDFLLWTSGHTAASFVTLDGSMLHALRERLDRFLEEQAIVRPESKTYARSRSCRTPEEMIQAYPPPGAP